MKQILGVFSERGDLWMQEIVVGEEESLRTALEKLGFRKFVAEKVDLDNPNEIYDQMTVRIKIWE